MQGRSLEAYNIRLATVADVPQLAEIELGAAQRFQEFGLPEAFSSLVTPQKILAESQALGCLWVAVHGHRLVGFVLTGVLGDDAHLEELNVLPAHGRQGLGSALVETACNWARHEGFTAMTLTTLQYIPWNAPFYQQLGFRILHSQALSPELSALLAVETSKGLSPQPRVAMRKILL